MYMRIKQRTLPSQLPELHDVPPLLTRIYAARGVRHARELDTGLQQLEPYHSLKGIEAATELLLDAIEQQQRGGILREEDPTAELPPRPLLVRLLLLEKKNTQLHRFPSAMLRQHRRNSSL